MMCFPSYASKKPSKGRVMNGPGIGGGARLEELTTQEKYNKSCNAAADLALLMARELQLSGLSSNSLRLFLLAYWSRVSYLAHTVHDNSV